MYKGIVNDLSKIDSHNYAWAVATLIYSGPMVSERQFVIVIALS